ASRRTRTSRREGPPSDRVPTRNRPAGAAPPSLSGLASPARMTTAPPAPLRPPPPAGRDAPRPVLPRPVRMLHDQLLLRGHQQGAVGGDGHRPDHGVEADPPGDGDRFAVEHALEQG